VKDLSNNDELANEIPKTAREFCFDNMLLKITKSKNDTYCLVIKNTKNPKHHHTFVAEEKNPSFHYTKESDGITPSRHKHIDYQLFQQSLTNILQCFFNCTKNYSR